MKLTSIFPAHTRPARKGIYRVHQFSGRPQYAYWNGRFWSIWAFDPELLYRYRNFHSCFQNKRWRGLAEEPKK